METSPLVSVLMTAYNRQKYIGEAIESVLASSYTNFELIIVDDFSSDKTVEIAYQYQAKDNRIQVFRNNKNLGQFTNRNKAIELSKGDFIKFLDSDDCLNENALSVMMKAFVEFPDAGLGLPIKDRFEKTPYQLQPHESVLFHFGGNNHLCYGPSATIYTRAAIERLGGFECEYGILADTLFNLKVASIFPTIFFEKDLFFWRRHSEQVTIEQENDTKMIGERYEIIKSYLLWQHVPLSQKEVNQIQKNFLKINAIHFARYLSKGAFREAFAIKKHTELSFLKLVNALL